MGKIVVVMVACFWFCLLFKLFSFFMIACDNHVLQNVVFFYLLIYAFFVMFFLQSFTSFLVVFVCLFVVDAIV